MRPARGGDITLGSQAGTITLASGAMLDPRGKAQTSNNPGVDPDGQITLRAGYDAANGTVRINPILATIEHTAPATLIVEGVRNYSSVSNVGDSGDLTTAMLATDLQDFATHTAAITAALTPPNADFTVQVRPGIDISSSGDLTVGSVLDLNALATNSSGGAPINLTLRAAGNLIVGASISDGFVSDGSASVPLWNLASGDSGYPAIDGRSRSLGGQSAGDGQGHRRFHSDARQSDPDRNGQHPGRCGRAMSVSAATLTVPYRLGYGAELRHLYRRPAFEQRPHLLH